MWSRRRRRRRHRGCRRRRRHPDPHRAERPSVYVLIRVYYCMYWMDYLCFVAFLLSDPSIWRWAVVGSLFFLFFFLNPG